MRMHITPAQRDRRDHAAQEILDPGVLHTLRKEQLWKLIKTLSQERKLRYVRRRGRRYGNINKGFSEEELTQFFQHCNHPTARMAFQLQAYLGLRIGEVVQLNMHPTKERNSWAYVDMPQRRVWLQTEKANTADYCQLHEKIYPPLAAWLQAHEKEILAHDGYILFAGRGKNPTQHISPNYLRNEFRRAAKAAGLDQTYGPSDERTGRASRQLHRLTTHSLRHYFITSVYRSTKDPVVAQRLARHTDNKSTFVYIHTTEHDLDCAITAAFGTKTEPTPTASQPEEPAAHPPTKTPPRYHLSKDEDGNWSIRPIDLEAIEQLIAEVREYMSEFSKEEVFFHLANYALVANWYVSGIKVQETPEGEEAYAFMIELVARLRKTKNAGEIWNRWALGRIGQVEVQK